jgi:hypothetical protein
MGVVIIPFDYEQLPDAQRKTIVPICIASVDRHGNLIAPIWFEQGVVPVQDQRRSPARYRSQVHKLWERTARRMP